MNTGRIFAGAVLFYGALCLVLAGLLLVLGSIFVTLEQGSGLAQALLLTGLIALAPVASALFVVLLRPRQHHPEPSPLNAEALLKELGSILGKEASDFVHAKPWQTMLGAALLGFVASSNPKFFAQLKKTFGL